MSIISPSVNCGALEFVLADQQTLDSNVLMLSETGELIIDPTAAKDRDLGTHEIPL